MLNQNSNLKLARSTALRYFSQVAESGSFRGAAGTLHIAASAINRQISNLEADLGVKLFERARGPAGLRLTDAGTILQGRLRSAMNELRIANEEIIALQGLQRGHLTIGVNDGMAVGLLPNAIRHFRSLYPNITFGIKVDDTRSLVKRLKERDIDLAIGYSFPTNDGLKFKAEISLNMYLLTSVDHEFAQRESILLSELGNTDLILPDNSLLLRQTLDTALESAGVRVHPIIETNSYRLIYSLVGRKEGISIVSGREDRGAVQERFSYVEINDDLLPGGVIGCCALADSDLSIAAEAFVESVSSAMERSFLPALSKETPL